MIHSPKITSIAALGQFQKLIVLRDGILVSYNLRVLVGVIHGKYTRESFEGSMERLSPKDQSVYLFAAGIMSERSLGACFASLSSWAVRFRTRFIDSRIFSGIRRERLPNYDYADS